MPASIEQPRAVYGAPLTGLMRYLEACAGGRASYQTLRVPRPATEPEVGREAHFLSPEDVEAAITHDGALVEENDGAPGHGILPPSLEYQPSVLQLRNEYPTVLAE